VASPGQLPLIALLRTDLIATPGDGQKALGFSSDSEPSPGLSLPTGSGTNNYLADTPMAGLSSDRAIQRLASRGLCIGVHESLFQH